MFRAPTAQLKRTMEKIAGTMDRMLRRRRRMKKRKNWRRRRRR